MHSWRHASFKNSAPPNFCLRWAPAAFSPRKRHLRLEKGWCDTPRGGRDRWQAQWMEPPVWVLACEGAQKQKTKNEGCTQAKRLQHPTIRPPYTVRRSLSTWRNFSWHAMMYSTPMKLAKTQAPADFSARGTAREVSVLSSFSCRAAPGVQTLRPVPLRQETASFALTRTLGPRRSLLVMNRVDVETRPSP